MVKGIEIFCKNTGEYVCVQGGETLGEIFSRIAPGIGITPICAKVNNKTEDLGYPVFSPKQVEYLDCTSPSGERVYVRSLCMIMSKAVRDLFPTLRLRIEHSVAGGYYALLIGADGDSVVPAEGDVAAIKARMEAIVAADVPFRRHERLTSDVMKMFEDAGLHDKAELLSAGDEIYSVFYTLDDTPDSYYGNLAPSSGHIRHFNLLPFKEGVLLLSINPKCPTEAKKPVEQEKMYAAFTDYVRLNRIIGLNNVADLNRAIAEGKASTLINVAEAVHNQRFARIAEQITERYRQGGARVVLIAGPSSSGKTTSALRLSIQLLTNFLVPKKISLDDYFVNREETPLDADGEYDYESLYALDLKQFNEDLNRLLAGEEVAMPTYDFPTGRRVYKGNTLKLGPNNVLLIEGIHGLNPELTKSIPEEQKFRVYVSALTTISIDDHNWVPTTDNRLLRRIIRDHKYRGVSAQQTIARWQSVRRGEDKWIFPYQENADATFNSSLLFELAVMKNYAEPLLRGVPHSTPEYAEAFRLRALLGFFKPLEEKDVPSTSLLREFLGGSSFHY
ncbi:MAG: nucleoside kinase [Bacteroidales bacterium]|nr:nucleoside kinase [Bacteroidales bacterium]